MVTSSSRLSGDLSNRGESAFDGDPVTFWSPQFGDQVGQWLQLQQPQPVTVDHLNLSVVADGHHSVPTRLSIQADGQRPVIADVPGVADLSRTNGTVQVPVTFPAVQGSTIRVTIDGVRQESTVDFLSGLPSVLPVGIAELGIPGVTLPPAGPTVPNACRTDLMTVDGNPTGVRIVGSTSAGSALQGLEVQACGPGSSGLSLGPGNHVVRTSQGAATGIDLDQLGLGSERGGAALAAGPTGQVVPTATTAASPVPSVRVLSQDRTTSKVAVDVPASKSPFWLVLGQSFNSGWTAQVNGGPSLGKPRSVDGYANGWLVQPRTSGQMLVTLHWKPQDRVNLALYVSAVAGILCLLLVFWRPRRRDDGDRHPLDTATTAATEPAGGDAPARPQLVSPLRSTGRPLSLQASLVVTLASAAVSGLVIGPWAAPVVGLAVAVVLLRPRLREIAVGLREIGFQFNGSAEVLNGSLNLALRQQHPAKRVVGGSAFGFQQHHLLERHHPACAQRASRFRHPDRREAVLFPIVRKCARRRGYAREQPPRTLRLTGASMTHRPGRPLARGAGERA